MRGEFVMHRIRCNIEFAGPSDRAAYDVHLIKQRRIFKMGKHPPEKSALKLNSASRAIDVPDIDFMRADDLKRQNSPRCTKGYRS